MAQVNSLDLEPEVEQRIERLAALDGDVLITGPSGSGKTEVARRIHELGARRMNPFVAQNCGAIPAELAESTLFGHERGAFTHAHQTTEGIVARAKNGTLFLDEIGEIPLAVQAKLLTFLQDRTYRRVGSTRDERASFRLIAATNKDLLEECNRGLFREDLFHRINGLPLALRPLRDAPERALRIAGEEVKRLGTSEQHRDEALSAVKRLTAHPAAWPGNIRELLSFVRRCVLGVEDAERGIRAEWARWRSGESAGRLTAFAPAVSPSLSDRERYAGIIHDLAGRGARPKAAASRKGSLDLASRLLDLFPEPLPLDEVQTLLGARDRRTLSSNVDLLVQCGIVQRSGNGILASWPPATSTLLGRRQGEWTPAGPGEILSVSRRDRVRIEITPKCAGTLGVLLVTHSPGGPPSPVVLVEGKELRASKTTSFEIELDGTGGLEQILLHVGPPGVRGGRFIDSSPGDEIMPDSAGLERGRRSALDKWHEGWLAEHLVFHTRGN